MKFTHEIISYKMCERMIDCWLSQRVEFHIERGLKVNLDGTESTKSRPVTKVQVLHLSIMHRKILGRESKA